VVIAPKTKFSPSRPELRQSFGLVYSPNLYLLLALEVQERLEQMTPTAVARLTARALDQEVL
jgi:hypothetical protein